MTPREKLEAFIKLKNASPQQVLVSTTIEKPGDIQATMADIKALLDAEPAPKIVSLPQASQDQLVAQRIQRFRRMVVQKLQQYQVSEETIRAVEADLETISGT